MRDDDVVDDDMDNALRALLPPMPGSSAWVQDQRERLLTFIGSGSRSSATEATAHRIPLEEPGHPRKNGRSQRLLLVGAAVTVAIMAIAGLTFMSRGDQTLHADRGTSVSAGPTTVQQVAPSSSARAEPGYTVVPTNVIGYEPAGVDDRIRVSRGSSSGITIGMPVVGHSGLVGTIVGLRDDESTVLLMHSEQYSAPASIVVQRPDGSGITSVEGTILGQGPGRPIVMRIADRSQPIASIRLGDRVVAARDASDLAQPKVPIGTITRIAPSVGTSDAPWFEIDPHSSLESLTAVDVLIVNHRPR